MNNLKSNIAWVIVVIIFCTSSASAQNNNKVPAEITAAFTVKYPKGEVKKWVVTNNQFTAKAKEAGQVFYATFNKNSQWLQTTSAISWSWKLPADVNGALKQSKYAAWRVDKLKKVETPNGDFYQVLVDNLFLQPDADHAAFADNYILEFKPNGELFNTKSISSALLF
jgi:hypothetical protein